MSIQFVTVGNLKYLTAEGISAPHCFTTRLGGVSDGYLSSLNLGIHRGDQPDNVLKNYEILSRELGFDCKKLVLSHQTHTDTILTVGEEEYGAGLFGEELPECDGLITNVPGTALVIFTADCTPILLHDPVTGAVGAVHAGWRGTAAQIAGKAVEKMVSEFGCSAKDIRAAIGPNIGPCCFETHEDVPQAMQESFSDAANAYIHQVGEKYYVNLKGLNALSLSRAGVKNIEQASECTACRTDLFWSHRRVGNLRGSQGALIVCK